VTFREEPLTSLRDQFLVDMEEILFRHAERAEADPTLRPRIQRAVRIAMRASSLEKRLGGDRIYRYLREVALHWARFRAERLATALGVDRDDARDLGRIQDWEDRLLGVTGHWTVDHAGCATKHETACPYADLAAKDPRICTDLVHALEAETFARVQPRHRLVPLSRLLSRGDGACDFRHEIAPKTVSAMRDASST
jgi:hypothetical protein